MDRYGDLFRLVVELSESRAVSVAYFALVATYVTVHSHRQRIAADLHGKKTSGKNEGSVVPADGLPTSWIRIYYLDGSHLSIQVNASTTIREICLQICLELKLGLYEVEQELGPLNEQKLLPANMTVGELIARWKAMRWPDAKLVAPVYLKDWAYQLSSRALRHVRFENSYLTQTPMHGTPGAEQRSPESAGIVIRRNDRSPSGRQSPVSDTSASVTPPMRARERTHALLNALFTTREVADPRELSATVTGRRWQDSLRRPTHGSPSTTSPASSSNGTSGAVHSGVSSGRRGTISPASPAVSTMAVTSSTPIATPLAVPVQGREAAYTSERAVTTPVTHQGYPVSYTPVAASTTASASSSTLSTPSVVRSAHRNGVPTSAAGTPGQIAASSTRRRSRQASPAVIAAQSVHQEQRSGTVSSAARAEAVDERAHDEAPAVQVTPQHRDRNIASSSSPATVEPPRAKRAPQPSPAAPAIHAATPQNGAAGISTAGASATPEPAPRRVSRSAQESLSTTRNAGQRHSTPAGHSNSSVTGDPTVDGHVQEGSASASRAETPDKVRPRTTVVTLSAVSRSRTPSPNHTGHAAQQHQHSATATSTVGTVSTRTTGAPAASATSTIVAAQITQPVTDSYPTRNNTADAAESHAVQGQETGQGRDSPATTASTLSTTHTPRHGHATAFPTSSPEQRQSQTQGSSPTRLMASAEDIAIHTAHARTNALLNRLFGNYPTLKQEAGGVAEGAPLAVTQAVSTPPDQQPPAAQPAVVPHSGEARHHDVGDEDNRYKEESEVDGTQTPPPRSRSGHHSQRSSGTFTLSRSTSPGAASVVSTTGSLHSAASGRRSQSRRRLSHAPAEPLDRPPFDTTVTAPTLSMLLALGQAEHGIGWQPRIVLDKKPTPTGAKSRTSMSKARSFPSARSPKYDDGYDTPIKDHSEQLRRDEPESDHWDQHGGDEGAGQGEDVRVRLFPSRRGSTGSTPTSVRSGSASKIPVRRGTTLSSPSFTAAPVTSPVPVPTPTTAPPRGPRTPSSTKGLTPSRSFPQVRGSPRPLPGTASVTGTLSPRGSFSQRRSSVVTAAATPGDRASARKLRAASPAVSITSAEHSSRHQSPFDFERRPPQNPHAAFGRTIHPPTSDSAVASVGAGGEQDGQQRSASPHSTHSGHSSAAHADGGNGHAQGDKTRRTARRLSSNASTWMGGAASAPPKTLWSAEELAEIEKVKEMYEHVMDWIKKHVYSGVPFRSGRKSQDPTSAMWAEPLSTFDERGGDDNEANKLTQEVLQSAPSGIMADRRGKVQILFSLVDLSYTVDVTDILKYMQDFKTMDGLPDPQPPALVEATKTTLELQWLSRLPYPPGIVQAVEVQYAVASATTLDTSAESRKGESKKGEYRQSDAPPGSPLRWFNLITRSYNQSQIGTYKWTGISPGSRFIVRLRYRASGTDWSEYSPPSEVFCTLPDKPRVPPPPTCIPVTSFAIQIMWGQQQQSTAGTDASAKRSPGDNGSPITGYLLKGKSVGDDFVELYQGPNKSYLLLGLYPENAYSFQVAAINGVGRSEFSSVVTVQTPAKPTRISSMARSMALAAAAGVNIDQLFDFGKSLFATAAEADQHVVAVSGFTEAQIAVARQCRDAWREYWDGTTEQTFYFNSILSIRQLKVPPVLLGGLAPGSGAVHGSHGGGSRRHTSGNSMTHSSSTDGVAAANGTSERVEMQQSGSRRRSNPSAAATAASPPMDTGGSARPSAPHGVPSVLDPKSPEMQFRRRRFRLLFALRRHRQNFAQSKDIIHLELRRGTMFADCFTHFAEMAGQDFKRRLRVSFVGERGLDCGGLSKEAYLLLSKQAAYYGGPKYHKWLRSVTSTVLVPAAVKKTDCFTPESTAEGAEDRLGRPPALKAPAPEPSIPGTDSATDISSGGYVEEQVEGYFLTAVNEQPAPPKVPENSSSNSAEPVHQGAKIDRQAEECYHSIFELDTTLHITSADYFRFLGRFLGKALLDRQLVDFPLSPLLLRHLLGEFAESATKVRTQIDAYNEAVALADSREKTGAEDGDDGTLSGGASPAKTPHARTLAQLEELRFMDQETYNSLKWMTENSITDIIYETFSVSDGKKDFPLCADGDKINVTDANKMEYIRLMIQWRISYSVLHNMVPFVTAFHEVVPLELLQKSELTPSELNAMLNGKSEVSVEELRAFCVYQGEEDGFNDTHDTIIWFWQAVRAFNQAERRSLLLFFTGSARVPLDGFDPPLNITQGDADMALNSLPRAHTCFNQLVLPRYSNFGMLYKQLKFAAENTVGFELA